MTSAKWMNRAEWAFLLIVLAGASAFLVLWILARHQQVATERELQGVRQQVCTNVRTVRQFLFSADVVSSSAAAEQTGRVGKIRIAAALYWGKLADNLVQPSCEHIRVRVPEPPRILRLP